MVMGGISGGRNWNQYRKNNLSLVYSLFKENPLVAENKAISPRTARVDVFKTFKRILLISMVANIGVAFVMLIFPTWVAEFTGLVVHPVIWVQYGAMMIIVITGTYVPTLMAPQANTFMGFYVGILRLILLVFFVIAGGGFIYYALFDGLFAVLLLVSYYQAYKAELMTL